MIRPLAQSNYANLQHQKKRNSAHYPLPKQQQRPRRQFPFSLRYGIWTVFLVGALAAFSRRRNFVEPPMHTHRIGHHDDAPALPLAEGRLRNEVSYDYRDVPIRPRSPLMDEEQSQQAAQYRYAAPRVIGYNFEKNEVVPLIHKIYKNHHHKRKHVYIALDYRKLVDENEEGKYRTRNKKKQLNPKATCLPMYQWQTAQFLSCNNVHETNMGNIRFINCGASRCAFQFYDIDASAYVLKTQFFDYVDERDMEFARKDALALERLTKSPYVANIYGSCGMTQTLEYSAYGNLFDWMKLTRAKQRSALSPVERLKFGVQMITAVADVHSINEMDGDMVSMTHNDICCHQFIHIDGIFKLGDFHLSTMHKRNRTSGEACKTNNLPMNAALKKVRAPEEMDGPVRTSREKVDVYLVGNMMYYILTHKWMFEGITTQDAMAKLRAGERSEFDFEPTNPADVAMVEAINWAWTQDSDKRPRAREVSQFLKNALQKIEGKSNDYIVRVSIPPLPEDYNFSDFEFYKNLGTDLDGKPL